MNMIVKCKVHPKRFITNVYIRSNCPLPSRLLCNICCHENKELIKDLLDFGDFLEDPLKLLSLINGKVEILDELNYYVKRSQKDPLQIIEQYQSNINKLLNYLLSTIEKQVDQLRKFQEMTKLIKDKFIEQIKHQPLTDMLNRIVSVENYHSKQDWIQLEQNLDEYIKQFHNFDGKELKLMMQNISKYDQECLSNQLFKDFEQQADQYLKIMVNEFQLIIPQLPQFESNLCPNFNRQILQKINYNLQFETKLLFRASDHGMSSSQFWNKCQNQGPTLVMCKSANGTVFGGYSPCKWIANGCYQQDETQTSFLFNSNRKEFYKLSKNKSSIYGHSTLGPTFGIGHDLYISENLQGGYSILGQSYSLPNQEQMNSSTQAISLFDSDQPELVEVEVFLIESIQ